MNSLIRGAIILSELGERKAVVSHVRACILALVVVVVMVIDSARGSYPPLSPSLASPGHWLAGHVLDKSILRSMLTLSLHSAHCERWCEYLGTLH